MPDDATESVAAHSPRLQLSIMCMPHLHDFSNICLSENFHTAFAVS